MHGAAYPVNVFILQNVPKNSICASDFTQSSSMSIPIMLYKLPSSKELSIMLQIWSPGLRWHNDQWKIGLRWRGGELAGLTVFNESDRSALAALRLGNVGGRVLAHHERCKFMAPPG